MMTPREIVDTLTNDNFSSAMVNEARLLIANRATELRREYLSGYALCLARTEWLTAQLAAEITEEKL